MIISLESRKRIDDLHPLTRSGCAEGIRCAFDISPRVTYNLDLDAKYLVKVNLNWDIQKADKDDFTRATVIIRAAIEIYDQQGQVVCQLQSRRRKVDYAGNRRILSRYFARRL